MTEHIKKWQKVEGLMAQEPPIVARAFVTSTEWGQIAEELSGFDLVDPDKPAVRPNPRNFRKLKIGKCLTICNSGTEDQDVCDILNWRELGDRAKIFAFRRDNSITGKKVLTPY